MLLDHFTLNIHNHVRVYSKDYISEMPRDAYTCIEQSVKAKLFDMHLRNAIHEHVLSYNTVLIKVVEIS